MEVLIETEKESLGASERRDQLQNHLWCVY